MLSDPGVLTGAVHELSAEEAQVHHKAGVVLTAPGLGHILFRVLKAVSLGALVEEVLLVIGGAVPGDDVHGLAPPLGAEGVHHGVEGLQGRGLQVNRGVPDLWSRMQERPASWFSGK